MGVGKVGEQSMWAPQEAGQHIPLQRERYLPHTKIHHSYNIATQWQHSAL